MGKSEGRTPPPEFPDANVFYGSALILYADGTCVFYGMVFILHELTPYGSPVERNSCENNIVIILLRVQRNRGGVIID